jgi:hypothetical protein
LQEYSQKYIVFNALKTKTTTQPNIDPIIARPPSTSNKTSHLDSLSSIDSMLQVNKEEKERYKFPSTSYKTIHPASTMLKLE